MSATKCSKSVSGRHKFGAHVERYNPDYVECQRCGKTRAQVLSEQRHASFSAQKVELEVGK